MKPPAPQPPPLPTTSQDSDDDENAPMLHRTTAFVMQDAKSGVGHALPCKMIDARRLWRSPGSSLF